MKRKYMELKSIMLNGFVMGTLLCGAFSESASARVKPAKINAQAYQQTNNSYSVWCDQVTQNLMQAQSVGWQLYRRQLYTQSTSFVLNALQDALASLNIPGSTFKPATYLEIMRTIALVNRLGTTQSNIPNGQNAALKAKTIAYVALQRISFISYVKDAVDVTYNIPCRKICGGQGYENPAYESALAQVAAEQLSRAQNYSSIVGSDGVVYPINDTPFYFVIISMAANWAAEDLSMSLFNTRFACAVMNLKTLGSRAASYQAMFGDVTAVQEIHGIVDELIGEMSYHPYGCGYHW